MTIEEVCEQLIKEVRDLSEQVAILSDPRVVMQCRACHQNLPREAFADHHGAYMDGRDMRGERCPGASP